MFMKFGKKLAPWWHRLLAKPWSDRRSEQRRQVHVPVRVHVAGAPHTGTLLDVSQRGAQIRLVACMPRPDWVDVECLQGLQRGFCRWSYPTDDGWLVGLEFGAGQGAAGRSSFLFKAWQNLLYKGVDGLRRPGILG